jgi:hypothetical protein
VIFCPASTLFCPAPEKYGAASPEQRFLFAERQPTN